MSNGGRMDCMRSSDFMQLLQNEDNQRNQQHCNMLGSPFNSRMVPWNQSAWCHFNCPICPTCSHQILPWNTITFDTEILIFAYFFIRRWECELRKLFIMNFIVYLAIEWLPIFLFSLKVSLADKVHFRFLQFGDGRAFPVGDPAPRDYRGRQMSWWVFLSAQNLLKYWPTKLTRNEWLNIHGNVDFFNSIKIFLWFK